MALIATHLVDKSALARLSRPAVASRLIPMLESGQLATCTVVLLEVLYSARSPSAYRDSFTELEGSFERVPMGQDVMDRALEVQGLLAQQSQHRGVSIPDLMIAATAERHGLTMLHYDADFDRVSTVTGQACEWVVERGSVT